MVMVMH